MVAHLDRRKDGSLALYLEGDLQFDSRDERIYHEALALPGLALAEHRRRRRLVALLCGGGDGLIARELLKSSRLARIDLVDRDERVLELARAELAELNAGSLSNPRLRAHVADAWEFVAQARQNQRRYDLVICDLTVPQDMAGARFHSVDWYGLLSGLLGRSGVLAVNAVSPSSATDAYWSIYNGLRASQLNPRPYHVALPSFAAAGYGQDWGFFLASPKKISAEEMAALSLATPRHELRDCRQLKRLFLFPEEIAVRRYSACPVAARSDLLLHYLYSGTRIPVTTTGMWDGLGFSRDPAPLPDPDKEEHLLPPSLREALSTSPVEKISQDTLLNSVLQLMPALNRFQTREMISSFLEEPSRFLASIDLPGLLRRLLQRTAELPGWFVAELRTLANRIADFAGDRESLLQLGMRAVTIITLVIIVGNLMFPDAVYGKGTSGAGASSHTATVSSISRSSYVGDFTVDSTATIRSSGFRNNSLGRGTVVDETGALYPGRTYYFHSGYNYYQYYGPNPPAPSGQPQKDESYYRLTPESDLLKDGQVAINLTEDAFLLVGKDALAVVEQTTGKPLLPLKADPTLTWRIVNELNRQKAVLQNSTGAKQSWIRWMSWLEFAPWRQDDLQELQNMREMSDRIGRAIQLLGTVPVQQPASPPPPIPGALEVFSNVWMAGDGSSVILQLAEGRTAFLDGKGWYSNREKTDPLADPYPSGFKSVVGAYLTNLVKNSNSETARLQQGLEDLQADLASLEADRNEYEGLRRSYSDSYTVDYGTREVSLGEALRLTYDDLAYTQKALASTRKQIADLPAEVAAAKKLLATFGS